jgi:hypothetical protein
MAHPSTESGSQLDDYLGLKTIASLEPKDPVRQRDYLPLWSEERGAAVQALQQKNVIRI